jgi:RNA polymerase sigma-70 factor (ECF subfamily)
MTTLESNRVWSRRRVSLSRPAQTGCMADSVAEMEAGDSLLIARVVAWDEEALSEIWSRHVSMVFGHAKRFTGSSATAEEVTQEVFVALWSHPDRFDPSRGSLRTFLALDTRGKSIDALRNSQRRRIREQKQTMVERTVSADYPHDGVDAYVTTTVREAISRLPDKQREAVELAYFSGLTHSEVATSLGIPEGTAKSRLRLAQAKLRTWLDQTLLEFT